MLVILAAVFVVHIAVTIMLYVATISNVWLKEEGTGLVSQGLWLFCQAGNCSTIFNQIHPDNHPSMRAVEAFMILSIIFCCFALMSFIAQLFTLEKGCRFYITGALMFVCFICILIGISIYTARFGHTTGWYHAYCFILTWICFCLSFILAILYMVLRKK
ncbi:epithelial membrane protein 1 [Anomaloglossus baeobatrachus]|uniref:epithelial membrane protein 1 n=1 Tax=Anomaloglossus baeobatrachus TaxID=238106 RepID=UPI003F50AFF6